MSNTTKMGLNIFVAFAAMACLMTSCIAQSVSNPLATTEMLTPTVNRPSLLPSVALLPTDASTLISPTSTLESQTLENIVLSQCINVSQFVPDKIKLSWNLLATQGSSLYVLDTEKGTKIKIPFFDEKSSEGFNKFSGEYYVSPDGKWLAYQNTASSKLFIEPAGTLLVNREQDRIVWGENRKFLLRRWVNNNTVLIIYRKSQSDAFLTTVFLNPFTGEEHEFSLVEMPNYLNYKLGGAVIATHYTNDGEMVPDPTMKKVIYPEMWNNGNYTTLWDVEARKPLTRLKYYIDLYNDPLWSQDGSNFLVVSTGQNKWAEWFLVTSDGVVSQVTRFSDFIQSPNYYFQKPTRSWDGRFLFFQLTYSQPNTVTKYILLDLKSRALEGYCIDSLPVENGGQQSPVWSPDSRYLIISNTVVNSLGYLILVDVENKKAYQIANDVDAIGWIVKP